GLDKEVWQYFTVVPDIKSTGVKDGKRTDFYPVIIRAVNSLDATEASVWVPDWDILSIITERILNEVEGVNRVLYDMSPKPPATIEWD
ncbi:MAG: glutamine-hydrolyzing GMP synthase, partial [Clostridiales bacterium]|nr:glutamine-hydrolyzing GMP synthase [Clostridiales bacterium]